AAQPHGDDRGEAADDEPLGVDDDPLLLDLGRLRDEAPHARAHLAGDRYAPRLGGRVCVRWCHLCHAPNGPRPRRTAAGGPSSGWVKVEARLARAPAETFYRPFARVVKD